MASKGKKSSPEPALTRLGGVVRLGARRRGTASEHVGAVLHTEAGEAVPLVRIDANPFDDPDTRALDGRRVQLEGYRVGAEFRFVRVLSNDPQG